MFSICTSAIVAESLPSECVVSGSPVQIVVKNGFVRGIHPGDDVYMDQWQSIQTNVFVKVGNSTSYPYTLVMYGGVLVSTNFSSSFESEADIQACLAVLVPLLRPGANISG